MMETPPEAQRNNLLNFINTIILLDRRSHFPSVAPIAITDSTNQAPLTSLQNISQLDG